MKKIVQGVTAAVLLLVIGFAGGIVFSQYKQAEYEEITLRNDEQIDLQLPGEVEKRIITRDEVETKLIEIDQLATYSGEYTVSKSADYSRYFLDDIPIPGSTNVINIECDGVVKVGYSVSDIIPTIDNESGKIYIALPEPTVLDNYPKWDSIKCSEVNNIFNPIDFAQYQVLISEIEQAGLVQAEEKGIYDAAESNVKKVIQNFLAEFREYEVVFL